ARDWLARYLIGDRPPALADLDAEPAAPFELDGPGDLLTLLAEQIDAVRATPTTPAERARAVVPLAAVALKALELNQLAARVEALEEVLKQRTKGIVRTDSASFLSERQRIVCKRPVRIRRSVRAGAALSGLPISSRSSPLRPSFPALWVS